MQISVVVNDIGILRSAHGEMEDWQRGHDVLGNCSTVPRNGASIDDKNDRLCVIEIISILDPDTWMSRDVHSLDGVLDIWKSY